MAAHYLKPLNEPFRSAVHLSVAVETRLADTADVNDSGYWLECDAWSISICIVGPEGNSEVCQKNGTTPLSLWDSIVSCHETDRTAWLWCLGLPKLLSVTDWYGMLESGGWRIGGSGKLSEEERMLGIKRTFRGYHVTGDPPNLVLARHSKTGLVLQMVDVRNFGVRTWAELCDRVGVGEDGAAHIDWDIMTPTKRAQLKSEILQTWVRTWCSLVMRQHWGPLRPTAASQAMTAFRTRYIQSPILIHGNKAVARLEREAYYTGRCECFRIGRITGPVFNYDFSSFYPSIAKGGLFPSRLAGYDQTGRKDIGSLSGRGYACIADVTIRTRKANYPYRPGCPVRAVPTASGTRVVFDTARTSTNIIYPVGTFRTVLCWPELERLYDTGSVLQVHRVAWYEYGAILRQWSSDMLDMRQAADVCSAPGIATCVKYLANLLYGAFAKRSRRWCADDTSIAPYKYCTWFQSPGSGVPVTRYRSIGGKVEYETSPSEGPETAVAVPAWLCSLARVKLQNLLQVCGTGECYYCDTDSVWCSARGACSIEDSIKGGVFDGYTIRLAGRYSQMTVYCQRCYKYDDTYVHSGAPADAAEFADGGLEWQVCESMNSALRRNDRPMPRMVRRRRACPERYNGGIVGLYGTVRPYMMGE